MIKRTAKYFVGTARRENTENLGKGLDSDSGSK